MKKFYCVVYRRGEITPIVLYGHIFTDKNGYEYGAIKEGKTYAIYNLITGMRVDTDTYPAHKLSEIQWAIDSVSDTVKILLEEKDGYCFIDKCRKVIEEAYKTNGRTYDVFDIKGN